jgi:cell division protein FtsI/penicillin-binding protein 2
MALRTGSRNPRAGAHRAPRAGSPVRVSLTKKARDGDGKTKTGAFGVALRSRPMLKRASVVIVIGALVAVGLVRGGDSSPEPTVYQFLLDWEQGNYQGAAALTTGQTHAVAAELSSAYGNLDATDLVLSMGQITQSGGSALALFNASIDLGSSGLQWTYAGRFRLQESGSTWRIAWSPSVIVPQLRAGDRLAVVQEAYPRAALLASDGQPLSVPSSTYLVGVIPNQLHGSQVLTFSERLVSALELQNLPPAQVAGQIKASLSNQFQELFTLTPARFASLRSRLVGIPGIQIQHTRQRLYDSIAPDVVGGVGTETAPVLREDGVPYRPGTTIGLSGLQQTFQTRLAGTPTTAVVIENAKGDEPYEPQVWQGLRGTPVRTTLDYNDQVAANSAIADLPGSAAIVAVQADSGKILAVSSHQAAGMPGLNPLGGVYQPGQAFTIVSGAALLATGHVLPASKIGCSPSSQVNGRDFSNVPADPVSLRTNSTFGEDFSLHCSTAFTVLSEIPSFQSQLSVAATEFGIGSDWQLPLSGSFPGTIGQEIGEGKVAADAIGQGDVRVSPLVMALAAATADSGRWHAPSLVPEAPSSGPSVVAAKETLSSQVLSELQGLMHNAVTHGSGSAANVGGNVYGQVGNAGFGGKGRLSISWFVGYQGGIAFAVAELVKSPSNTAASVAGSFLRNIRTGS